jgi:hypothetical protein
LSPAKTTLSARGAIAPQQHAHVLPVLKIRRKPVEISSQKQRLRRTLSLFEVFKVEDGQITAIEVVTRNMSLGAELRWSIADKIQ